VNVSGVVAKDIKRQRMCAGMHIMTHTGPCTFNPNPERNQTMMNATDIFGGIIGMITLWVFTYVMFVHGLPAIDAWETANGYPYGMLCDVFNSCNPTGGK
jgi:hypothetical protein